MWLSYRCFVAKGEEAIPLFGSYRSSCPDRNCRLHPAASAPADARRLAGHDPCYVAGMPGANQFGWRMPDCCSCVGGAQPRTRLAMTGRVRSTVTCGDTMMHCNTQSRTAFRVQAAWSPRGARTVEAVGSRRSAFVGLTRAAYANQQARSHASKGCRTDPSNAGLVAEWERSPDVGGPWTKR